MKIKKNGWVQMGMQTPGVGAGFGGGMVPTIRPMTEKNKNILKFDVNPLRYEKVIVEYYNL